jgi:hypothetical protein
MKDNKRLARVLISLTLGLLCGIFVHYLCYRLAIPAKPFIYVAF